MEQDEIRAELEKCADHLRALNPDRLVYIDEGAVWIRDEAKGKDYGIYSATITGQVVRAVDAQGRTVLHRAIPAAAN